MRSVRRTLALLCTEVDCWVASADKVGDAHLVPLSFYWDGAALVLATPRSSPTGTNLLRAGVARVGVGPTRDVVLVDGRVTEGVDDATADAHTEHTAFAALTDPATTRAASLKLKEFLKETPLMDVASGHSRRWRQTATLSSVRLVSIARPSTEAPDHFIGQAPPATVSHT